MTDSMDKQAAEPDTGGHRERAEVVAEYEGADGWGVRTILGKSGSYREKPCTRPDGTPTCPWLTDSPTGYFPPEVFRHSAKTAYDLSMHQFGCHTSPRDNPMTCAGFLLRGAAHNMTVRMHGPADDAVSSDMPLYNSYRDMAIANGVDPDDPGLAPCRDNGTDYNATNAHRRELSMASNTPSDDTSYTRWAYFPSKVKAEACRAELAGKHFTVMIDAMEDFVGAKLADADDRRWLLRAITSASGSDLLSQLALVDEVVHRHGGVCDGGEADPAPTRQPEGSTPTGALLPATVGARGAMNLPDLLRYLRATSSPLPGDQAEPGSPEWIDRIEVSSVATSLLNLFTEIARYDSELVDLRPDIARRQLTLLAEALRDNPDFDKHAKDLLGVDRAAEIGEPPVQQQTEE